MDVFEKELKKQWRAIKRIEKNLDVAIRTFDRGHGRLHKRVDRIETHLALGRME